MARKAFFVSGFKGDDSWVDHALQVKREGVCRDGAEDTPTEAQVTTNAQGNRVARVKHKDPAIGLDSEDVHMGGDRCVVTAEIPDPASGDLRQYIERYSDSGRFIGSFVVPWYKVGEGRHQKGTPRRINY
jgi:hypothetical protein